MKNKTWNGIMKILEVQHLDPNGKVLWQQKNVYNLLHLDGEEFLLRAAFTGGRVSTIIPDSYYLGLDNRQSVIADQTMDNIIGEPQVNGYSRQEISSSGDFSLNLEDDHYIATSPIVAFRALSGSWGPVTNLFLTDQTTNGGFLISTAVLETGIVVNDGESVTMRIGIMLKCPD